jgi:NADH-quinone oxidoreductase subunit M
MTALTPEVSTSSAASTTRCPCIPSFTVIAFFAAIGLPSMSGFVSEAFVFLGAFQVSKLWTILSTLGIVLGAGYMLWTFQRVFMGTLPEKWERC